MPPKDKSSPMTVNALATLTNKDRATVKKRLEDAGIQPVDVRDYGDRQAPRYPVDLAVAAINTKPKGSSQDRVNNARADQIEREVAKQDAIDAGELMRTEDVVAVLSTGLKGLETIPSRAQSELGLSNEQVKKLERMIDEVRVGWSDKVKEMEKKIEL